MRLSRLGPTGTLMLSLLLPGCRWAGWEGPVSQSVATCRQLTREGIAAAEQGRQRQAESFLAKAVKACPLDPEAKWHYAETLWRRGARSEAIAQLEEAARLATADAPLRVRLAEMHLATGRMKPARENADQAIDLDPKLGPAWAVRGRVMRTAGCSLEALADFHRSLGYAPGDRQVLLEVAELYRELDRPQRALASLQSLADTYSPGEEPARVLYLIGLAQTALGRHDDAVESLMAAAAREKTTPEILCRLGEAELLAGNPVRAASAAHRALTLDPEHKPSRQLLARLEVARRSGAAVGRY